MAPREERRRYGEVFLSEEQELRIATVAAEQVKHWLYVEVGKAAVRAFFILVGLSGAVGVAWLGLAEKVVK